MTRCRLCDSPLTPKGCPNADCGLWEGPGTEPGVPVPPRDRAKERARMLDLLASMDIPSDADAWAEEVERRYEQFRDDEIAARLGG